MSYEPETLKSYFLLVPQMNRAEFESEYPHPFLVQVEEGDEEEAPQFTTAHYRKDDAEPPPPGHGLRYGKAKVFLVKKRPGNAFQDMINVGRALNNDIVLPYSSISKFHAFFSRDKASKGFLLTDAHSTNGTFVNGQGLVADKEYHIHTGDIVAFSLQVPMKFYLSGDFFDWAKAIIGGLSQKA